MTKTMDKIKVKMRMRIDMMSKKAWENLGVDSAYFKQKDYKAPDQSDIDEAVDLLDFLNLVSKLIKLSERPGKPSELYDLIDEMKMDIADCSVCPDCIKKKAESSRDDKSQETKTTTVAKSIYADGDTVVIVDDLEKTRLEEIVGIVSSMEDMEGKCAVITGHDHIDGNVIYTIKDSPYQWTHDSFKGAVIKKTKTYLGV